MKNVIVVLCGVVGLALTVGAQASMPGHSARSGDGTPGVAAGLQQIEDFEAVRAIPEWYGHDLIFKHLRSDQTVAEQAPTHSRSLGLGRGGHINGTHSNTNERRKSMRIDDTIALVTGANRGIGAALVEALLGQGASKVYAAARQDADVAALRAKNDRRIVPVQLDVTDAAQVERVAAEATDLRILFNNAGVLDLGSVLDAPSSAFDRNFDVNVFGLLHTTRAFAPALTTHQGAVVNILTLVALASMPSLGVYNASKAAAWSLTQSMRGDFARRQVKVFGVFPGAVDTDMLKGVEMPKASPADVAAAVLEGIEADEEDIFPDPMARALYAQWTTDHKAIERQFAAM